MAVRCRFLRSPVVTPSTDVVIVGGEVLGDDSEKVETGVAVGGEEQKQRASILAQLHDYLRITYGIPVERIVTVEWLRECYKRMILLNVSDADVGRGPVFQAAPMPLAELPKTERFYLQPIASATVMASYEEPHRQQQQQQQLIKMKKAATRSNQRKKSGDERTAVCSADDRKRQVDGCGTVKSSDDAQKRYEADLSVVVRRVNDILTLLNGTADAASREVSTFTTALFCFIDNDFSRIGLSIVRALINYGKGMWLKKTREDWAKSLSQLNSEGCEQDTGANHQENKEQTEYNALSTLRRLSSIYKRLLRAQDDVASVTQAVSPVAVEVAVLGQLDEHNNFQHLVGAASPVGELQHVFRVIPHGDQRPPVALHVASSHRRPPEHNRCPLRFLPAVTQDYIFCSLAAGHLLQPRSCFLFYTPTPTEAGRLARRQLLRMSDGHTAASINSTGTHASTGWRQFVLSSWLGPRKNEKGPLFGVCVYFLCLMPHRSTKDHRSEVSEEVETALVLRRVLLSCLSTAVGELGGRTADAFSQEAVTHVVVVEVASILASTISHIDGDMGRGGVTTAFASIRCCFRTEEVGEERLVEALISRGSSWPREVHKGLLPQDLVKYASEGRVSLVGMEWLEASVLWGTFLDETPFTLSLQFNDKKQCGERSTTCGTVVARSTFEYSCSTPPPTPMRVTDITLLPFSSTVRHNSDSNSPRQTDNYQFDFSTPGPTPLRPTLRSPGKKREGVSPLTSPSLLLEKGGGVFEALNHGGGVDDAGLLCKSTSGRNNVPCDREAIMEANEEVTENPHDPVRRTLLLDDNEGSKDGKPQECHRYPLGVCDAARCEESERVDGSPSPRIPATAQKDVKRPQRLSQLWSPEDKISGNKHCGQRPAFPTSDCTIGTPLPANAERQQINASFSAPRIYIVHDTPGKDDLREFCVKLSNPGLQGNNGNALNIGDDISNQWQPQQQHLRGGCEPARTITCVNIVNSPKDADILVTHQFSQRESVLAALAAGLWIVTPKVLEDCRANHSFGPLHNLSLYEWCPEILPHDAQWNTVQLAKQCRGRRQQRQATGQRLFENMHFVLVTLAPIATPAVTARARSLMSVLDIGGGGVTWSLCWDDGGSNGVLVPPVDEVNFRQQALGSVDPKVSCEPGVPHATPPQMLLDLVLLQIEGSVDYGCNEKRVGSCAEVKEIIILLDDHKQENVLTKQLHNDIIKVFKDAQQQLAKAKRGAQGRLQEGLRQGRQGDQPSAEVSRKALGPNCLAEGQPTRGIRPVAPAALDCDVEVTESSGDVIGRVRGMPSLRSLRVFKCDWICFTIQKRRKVPLCTVDL
uniref:WGS project CAEQ00000000 data, annotated contig 2250 n=1 Tax=Trypanosoma congolense (strain IL3000) TaxID=1068625 RepID=F9WCN1_TRYCI|nr:unnamed protein product [Trypanosoma congolense IL3000]